MKIFNRGLVVVGLLLLILTSFVSNAHAQNNLAWVRSYAHPTLFSGGAQDCNDMFVDAAGNTYSTGSFSGTVDFDPGPGVFNLSATYSTDAFVIKLDPNGNLVWAKAFNGTYIENGGSITIDATGNVYTTGVFTETTDFDPGPGVYNLSPGFLVAFNTYIVKLDPSGNLVWAKSLVSETYNSGTGIQVSSSGSIYLTGDFNDTTDFDPSVADTFELAPVGADNIYVLKLSNSGNFIWVKQMEGTGNHNSFGMNLTLDSYGHVFTTGKFTDSVDFDPDTSSAYFLGTTIPSGAGYISALDTNGNFVWAGSMGYARASSIITDPSGNIFTTGDFGLTADFDMGPGVYNLTSAGNNDMFIAKYTNGGNLVWVKRFGSPSYDNGSTIVNDATGNLYITGAFSGGTVDFDPGPGVHNLTSVNEEAFVLVLDNAANYIWSGCTHGSGSGGAVGQHIGVDALNNMYVSGNYSFEVDFDPGPGNYPMSTVIGAPGEAIFEFKLTSNGSYSSGIDSESGCDNYTWIDGNTYNYPTNTPTYIFHNANASGCDSVVTLHLSMHFSTITYDAYSVCDQFTYNGTTYTTTGNYYDTLSTIYGCDSVVMLLLTIRHSTSSTDVHVLCNNPYYIWIDDLAYTSSNQTATFTVPNHVGCDSVIHLDLTANLDNTVSQSGNQLSANQPAATYQWITCPGNTPIPGATSNQYIAPTSGSYAVIVTLDGCTATSACTSVTVSGIEEYAIPIQIYPNPTHDIIQIATGDLEHANLKLLDLYGRIVIQKMDINGSYHQLDLSEMKSGIYILEISDGEYKLVGRVVKE
jgi:hypothetical protein